MSRIWMTAYCANPGQPAGNLNVGEYGTFLEARTRKDAEALAIRRGMGEVVQGESLGGHDVPRASRMIRKPCLWPKRMETLHAITFICYLAMQSKVLQPYEVLGDQGILHEAIHQFLHGGPNRKKLSRELERIEGLIPGFPKAKARRRRKRK